MNLNDIIDDLFVVDFTEYQRQHPKEKLPADGVMFIEQPDERVGAFCILNPDHLSYEVINLETNPNLTTDESGNQVKQPECICKAHRDTGKRWVLLLELKYCTENNIPRSMQNALEKFIEYYDFLKEKKHFFDDNSYRVYVCASHPEHEVTQPFGEFIFDQNKILVLNEEGVKLLYCNAVKILTPEYLAKTDIPRRYQFVKQ